jgi:hypothetical protein
LTAAPDDLRRKAEERLGGYRGLANELELPLLQALPQDYVALTVERLFLGAVRWEFQVKQPVPAEVIAQAFGEIGVLRPSADTDGRGRLT